MAGIRSVAQARCIKHPDAHIVAMGTYATGSGPRRRYRCTPVVGDVHTFSTLLPGQGEPVAIKAPPPLCPKHPASNVVRHGTYGSKAASPRQRYRCTPSDGSKPHAFTPPLPRDHVHEGKEHCEYCEELRGVHHGETAVARRHSWSTRVVVRSLEDLANGKSYAKVSRTALRITNTTSTRKPPPPRAKPPKRKASPSTRTSRNAWHIAADWVEAFSPVIYEPIEQRLHADALSERQRLDEMLRNGEVLDTPQVVLIDEVPVYGRSSRDGTSNKDDGYSILVLAEAHWDRGTTTSKLRLVRAMPRANKEAWLLLLDELGYDPDYLVADGASGIFTAYKSHFGSRHTKFVPSLWHLANRINRTLLAGKGAHVKEPAGPRLVPVLEQHVRLLGRESPALATAATWAKWWDEFDELLKELKLPRDSMRKQRVINEATLAAVLPDLNLYPGVPISTGGLESLITSHIEPMLAMRRSAFANIERTNRLFDLVVANSHGAFDHPSEVAALLRADADKEAGWTVPLRAIADPKPRNSTYSSLRDATLLTSLAERKGLL